MSELPPLNPDVVHQRVGDEVVLVHLKTNQIFALNETGARFWDLYSAGGTRAEIEATMVAEFEVEPHMLAGEIDGLLAALAREGLIATA